MRGEAVATSCQRLVGLVVGIAAFSIVSIVPAPHGVSGAAWNVAALGLLMAIWWMSEALPLAATALAPIVVLPLLGTRPIDAVVQSYAHPLVFLFLGGFLIAKALERWNLHTRIAGSIIRFAPRTPTGVVGATMITTAFLSMWISNTAAALVMVPIAQSIAHSVRKAPEGSLLRSDNSNIDFSAALMLGVAFSATIGGMATLIGTPPNALLAGYLQTAHGLSIGFGQWMGLGVPVMLVLLPITWILLTRIVFEVAKTEMINFNAILANPSANPEPMSAGAKIVALTVATTGLVLILRPVIQNTLPSLALSDAGILMTASLILFALPVPGGENDRLLNWDDAKTIRWDVIILFGGGLALADAIEKTGLSQAAGSLFAVMETLPLAMTVLIAMVVMVYLGELASNTAMAAIFLPLAGAAAVSLGASPLELVVPIGLAASLGFMLPVATPPNAIAFGTGQVSSGQMLKAGALLDVIGIAVVYPIAILLGPIVLG